METLNYLFEEWRDIKGYEGIYRVSNLGRVKSLERFKKGKNGSLASVKQKILKPQMLNNGYYLVTLYKNSIGKMYLVHRLVWIAFNGTIPKGLQVNHINEIKTDNRLSNLNLMAQKENLNWGTRNERSAKNRSKSVLQFTLDNILVKEYPSTHQVYRELGFSYQNICACCNGKLKQAYNYIWKYKE